MKKGLLFFALTVSGSVLAQSGFDILNHQVPLLKIRGEVLRGADADRSKLSLAPVKPVLMKKGSVSSINFIELGTTKYDLQTNASVGRRIITDGTNISAVWTTSADFGPNYNTRGTGYNYYDGTSWMPSVQTRIEPSTRTGWPSVGYLTGGVEVIMGHVATAQSGGFRLSKNTGPKTSFTTGSSEVLDGGVLGRPIWGRMATDGNQTIHIIANYSDSSSDNPMTTKIAGVRDPMVYSRSKNGGNSWDKINTILPGYDSTKLHEGGGDQYAIDVRGDVVAILCGGLGDPVMLWKSTDAGDNFTLTIIDSFAVLGYNGNQAIGANNPTCDGSVDVLIDNNNNVHAFWGLTFLTNRPGLPDSSLFTPGSNGLVYWNEISKTETVIAEIFDNGNATLDIGAGTTSVRLGQDANGNDIGGARYGNTSLVTMPSAGISGDGKIFLVYSAPVEEATTVDFQNFRDVYVVYSDDNGATWKKNQNITQTPQKEDVFACIPKRFGTAMPVIFQRDDEPGTALQNEDPNDDNQIMFALIPVQAIVDSIYGHWNSVPKVESTISVVAQNFPNPFSDETVLNVFMTRPAAVTLTVTNLIGQQVSSTDLGKIEQGNTNITINRNGLKSGVYFYTLSNGSSSVTGKMVVE